LAWGAFEALHYAQKIRIEKSYQTSRRIAELQIRSMYNQLDPHFTLNLINSIGSLFLSKKTGEANYYFGKYAKMLREMILSSDKLEIPLKDELDFCQNYLLLEQFRMNNSFQFEIEIENQKCISTPIPRLLVHSFVENAVKHGIKHLEKQDGRISIHVSGEREIKISIVDNGIGREKAKAYSLMSTGKGLKIVDETLTLYNSLRKKSLRYTLSDLFSSTGEPSGTKVEITVGE